MCNNKSEKKKAIINSGIMNEWITDFETISIIIQFKSRFSTAFSYLQTQWSVRLNKYPKNWWTYSTSLYWYYNARYDINEKEQWDGSCFWHIWFEFQFISFKQWMNEGIKRNSKSCIQRLELKAIFELTSV